MSRKYGLFTSETEPHEIRLLLERCTPPPPLHLLDMFRTDGLKSAELFSHPDYFVNEWKRAIIAECDEIKAKRVLKKKPVHVCPSVVFLFKLSSYRIQQNLPDDSDPPQKCEVFPDGETRTCVPPPNLTMANRRLNLLADIRSMNKASLRSGASEKVQKDKVDFAKARERRSEAVDVAAILKRRAALEMSESDSESVSTVGEDWT
ncbi:hypothetical protein BDR26DRAFT_851176 [Obelidium mucronatum]|nr:hypothetical protein BDR26DRAFT_851176 [Obelidium mucronatum]